VQINRHSIGTYSGSCSLALEASVSEGVGSYLIVVAIEGSSKGMKDLSWVLTSYFSWFLLRQKGRTVKSLKTLMWSGKTSMMK